MTDPKASGSAGDHSRKAELDQALRDFPGGIGRVIRYLRAAEPMENVVRDVLQYRDVLPEEVTEPARAAVDILDGGDGVIYR